MSLHPDWIALVIALVLLAGVVVLLLRSPAAKRTAMWRRLAMVVAFLLIAIRPVVGADNASGQASNLDVILMIDRTTSMAAEDYNGQETRLSGVQHDAREIVTQFTGARFVVVTFDNDARAELPASTDTTAVVTLIDAMTYMDPYYGAGSSIDIGLEPVATLLDEMAEAEPGRQRLLVYLGDGEQTIADPPKSFAPLADKIDGAAVLGYGTPSGGRMRYEPDRDRYVYNPTGSGDAISKIDEEALRTIATDLGGEYQHRSEPNELQLDGPDQGFGALSGGEVSGGNDLTWIFATVLVGLALWELWVVAHRFRHVRRELM